MKAINLIHRMSKFILLTGFVFTSTLYVNSQVIAQTGAIDDVVEDVSSNKQEITVWAVPAEQKVRPEDRVEVENLIWSDKEKVINVAGAGNEHVPFQVVITTSVKGSPREIEVPNGFMIQVSDLISEQGYTIKKEYINCYLEHYIMLCGTSGPVGATGYWPDAIVPIQRPFSMAAQYDIVKNRPIWIDLFIPPQTKAGKYHGNIEVSQKLITKICKELDIEEYKLELPIKYSFQEFIKLCKKENAFVFLGLHGGKGEDGTIQKELTKNGLLYNGSDEKGSRLGMDKYETGKLIESLKDDVLITAPKVKFKIGDFKDYNNEKDFWDNVVNKLSSNSFIIKPATDGSSAGAVRIYDLKDFKTYIDILKDKAPYIPANTFKNQGSIIEMPSNNEQDFLLEAFIEML